MTARTQPANPTAVECVSITEIPGRDAVTVLNETVFGPLRTDPRQFTGMLRSFCVMGRAQLAEDIRRAPADALVPVSGADRLAGAVMELKLCLTEGGDFVLLTLFGGKADPATTLCDALEHAIKVLSVVEVEYS